MECKLVEERFSLIYFEVTNIGNNVQTYSSEFDGLLREKVSKEPFIIKEISYNIENVLII